MPVATPDEHRQTYVDRIQPHRFLANGTTFVVTEPPTVCDAMLGLLVAPSQ